MDRYEPLVGGTTYEVGNDLRGWHHGKFASDEEAWSVLSERFNKSFPSLSGRAIIMRKVIGCGMTAGGNETERDKELRLGHERALAEDRAAEVIA